ncbi:MAG: hypothetical protein HQ594_04050, partial [Candidatus Omnitrophica bacterium]|nr:hypothetical protein [Candidatus Omnitrophota bacterium]
EVLIKALVVDASQEFINKAGIKIDEVVFPPKKFALAAGLIDEDKRSVIESEMTIRTLSGETASLKVALDKVFGGTLERKEGYLVYSPPVERSAGEFLEVLPRVNSDGTITVTIRPEVSEFQKDQSIYERTLLTQVTVNSGDTVLLGNIARSIRRGEEGGLPVLGETFSEKRSKKNNVLIFLTVDVVE